MSDILQSLGIGGVGGILAGILTVFGFNIRLRKLERETQSKEVCRQLHGAIDSGFSKLDNSIVNVTNRIDGSLTSLTNRIDLLIKKNGG